MKVKNIPVVINKEVPGSVSQRLQNAIIREACSLVQNEVISIKDLDLIIRNGLAMRYMVMGIFEIMDWEGIDEANAICEYVLTTLDETKKVPEIITQKLPEGKLALRSGEGFYDYPEEVSGFMLANWYNNYYDIEKYIYK